MKIKLDNATTLQIVKRHSTNPQEPSNRADISMLSKKLDDVIDSVSKQKQSKDIDLNPVLNILGEIKESLSDKSSTHTFDIKRNSSGFIEQIVASPGEPEEEKTFGEVLYE